MVNAYTVDPRRLHIQTQTVSVPRPLQFSATQLNPETAMPYGMVSVKGKLYVGSLDDYPMFVKYPNGGIDILSKPDSTVLAQCTFAVSGVCVLRLENKTYTVETSKYARANEILNRVILGINDEDNVFILFRKGTLKDIIETLKAYKIHTAILLASDNVYFDNSRNDIHEGECPVVTMYATAYEEVPSPIVVIDFPQETWADDRARVTRALAHETYMHLKENYYGQFVLAKDTNVFTSIKSKVKYVNALCADFVLFTDVFSTGGDHRALECHYSTNASSDTLAAANVFYTKLFGYLAPHGIDGSGVFPKLLDTFDAYTCPAICSKVLNISNAEDAAILEQPKMLRLIGVAQAEALAEALGLSKLVSKTRICSEVPLKEYRVNVGQFKYKLGAEELCGKLRAAGFDAYITEK